MTQEEVKNINWKDIVTDAKVMKNVDIEWNDSKVRFYYKELLGDEGLSIENKFPDNVGKVLYEKAFTMIAKANPDVPDEVAKLSRQDWDNLPERVRNQIIQKIFMLERFLQENFQNTLDQN